MKWFGIERGKLTWCFSLRTKIVTKLVLSWFKGTRRAKVVGGLKFSRSSLLEYREIKYTLITRH